MSRCIAAVEYGVRGEMELVDNAFPGVGSVDELGPRSVSWQKEARSNNVPMEAFS